MYFMIPKINYLKKNFVISGVFKKSIKKINFFSNNNYFVKLTNKSKKSHINYFFKINKNYYNSFNNFNKLYFKNFLNILNNFFKFKSNFLIIDNDYRYITPFFNKMYDFKNISSEKNFFFLKKHFLSTPNWLYLYKFFLKKYNISFILFLDYYEFKNFFNIFSNLNKPLFSMIPISFKNSCLDYYFFVPDKMLEINKLVLFNFTVSSFFLNYNKIKMIKKTIFISKLKNYFINK